MIKTIDDLRKCYAVRADKEVFELFMDKCEELGVTWNPESPREIKFGEAVVFSGASFGHLGHQSESYMIDKGYKRLTLSDFKPTRTEYVQVAESIFDLSDEFERGKLWCRHVESIESTSLGGGSGITYGYSQITSELDLFGLAASGDAIYRRVEKAVDWHSDLDSYLNKPSDDGFEKELPTRVRITLNDIEFHLTDSEYLESCRVALRANGEID